MVDTFIADLRDAVNQAKTTPSGKGTMVALYGAYPISCIFFSYLRFLILMVFSVVLYCFLSIKKTLLIARISFCPKVVFPIF